MLPAAVSGDCEGGRVRCSRTAAGGETADWVFARDTPALSGDGDSRVSEVRGQAQRTVRKRSPETRGLCLRAGGDARCKEEAPREIVQRLPATCWPGAGHHPQP